jgi:hypothetical protein
VDAAPLRVLHINLDGVFLGTKYALRLIPPCLP